jgi:hypothetical protein
VTTKGYELPANLVHFLNRLLIEQANIAIMEQVAGGW